ncbi:MAG TPA: RidA family protein [Pyrinomonadaceae bacterium]|jgi:2-iminobutanoate/2-iminopropanoate deaminase|nr:RidA family protein [Pyrinomonadaceae bacterium]
MKRNIATDKAPLPIGPYSQAVVNDGYVFVSGQVPFDPQTGEFVEGDIAVQTERVLQNISAILLEAGTSLDHVVKTTVFLADMNDFVSMNEAYARYFKSTPPARSTVEVARLPRDARIEIEVIAAIPTR